MQRERLAGAIKRQLEQRGLTQDLLGAGPAVRPPGPFDVPAPPLFPRPGIRPSTALPAPRLEIPYQAAAGHQPRVQVSAGAAAAGAELVKAVEQLQGAQIGARHNLAAAKDRQRQALDGLLKRAGAILASAGLIVTRPACREKRLGNCRRSRLRRPV